MVVAGTQKTVPTLTFAGWGTHVSAAAGDAQASARARLAHITIALRARSDAPPSERLGMDRAKIAASPPIGPRSRVAVVPVPSAADGV